MRLSKYLNYSSPLASTPSYVKDESHPVTNPPLPDCTAKAITHRISHLRALAKAESDEPPASVNKPKRGPNKKSTKSDDTSAAGTPSKPAKRAANKKTAAKDADDDTEGDDIPMKKRGVKKVEEEGVDDQPKRKKAKLDPEVEGKEGREDLAKRIVSATEGNAYAFLNRTNSPLDEPYA